MPGDILLAYGRTQRVSGRWRARQIALRGFLAASILAALGYGIHVLVYFEEYRARARLGHVPGVESVEVGGYTDGGTFEARSVSLVLEGRPDGHITFHGVPAGRAKDRWLRLNTIGPVSFEVESDRASCSEIELGTEGDFAGLVAPLEIHSAADVVTHYDALIAALKAAPPAGTLVGPSGTRYDYTIHVRGRDW